VPRAAIFEHGVPLQGAESLRHSTASRNVATGWRNRGAGPFGLLNLFDDHCGGVFDLLRTSSPRAVRDEFMLRYKTAAGFAVNKRKDKRNAAASTIVEGAKVR